MSASRLVVLLAVGIIELLYFLLGRCLRLSNNSAEFADECAVAVDLGVEQVSDLGGRG
jgi:hypothetical protein